MPLPLDNCFGTQQQSCSTLLLQTIYPPGLKDVSGLRNVPLNLDESRTAMKSYYRNALLASTILHLRIAVLKKLRFEQMLYFLNLFSEYIFKY